MNELANQRKIWGKNLTEFLKPIVWCEKCGVQVSQYGDKAHRRKRRYILTIQEYFMAARLCRECHKNYDENWNREDAEEFDSHQIMFDEITELVVNRDTSELNMKLWPGYPEDLYTKV